MRVLLRAGTAVLVVLAALGAWAFLVGVTIDATRWRDVIAARAGEALGRDVAIGGKVRIGIGRELALEAQDVRLSGPRGFKPDAFAHADALRLRIGAKDAIAAMHWRAIELDGVQLTLARTATGANNWTFAGGSSGSRGKRSMPAIDALAIRGLAIDLVDGAAPARPLLARADVNAAASRGAPVAVRIRGDVRGSVPCEASLRGDALDGLDRAWPVTLDAACGSTSLHATGAVDFTRTAGTLDIGFGTARFDEIAALLDSSSTPPALPAALATRVAFDASRIDATRLRGEVAGTAFTGRATFDASAPRPRLTAELATAEVDLTPWTGNAAGGVDASSVPHGWAATPVPGALPLDVAIALRVDRWRGMPIDLHATRVDVQADARGIRVPWSGVAAAVPLSGELRLTHDDPRPLATLEARSEDADLAAARDALPAGSELDGRVRSVALRLAGRGATLGELARDLEGRLDVESARGRYRGAKGKQPFEISVDALQVTLPRNGPLNATGRGRLLGEKTRVSLRTAPLAELIGAPVAPIAGELRTSAATARIDGRLSRTGAARTADLDIRLDSARIGHLASWLDVSRDSPLPLAVRGRVHVEADAWRIEDANVKVGRTEFTLNTSWQTVDGRPVVVAAIRSPLIHVPELESLRAQRTVREARGVAHLLDVPIIPAYVDIADIDVGLGLERVIFGRVELADVGFAARIRDGRLPPAHAAATLAGVPLAARAAANLGGAAPELSVEFSAADLDAGALLRALGVADMIEHRAGRLEAKLDIRGGTLREILESAALDVRLTGGHLSVRRHALPIAALEVDEVAAMVRPGQPVTAHLAARANDERITLDISTGTLLQLAELGAHVPFTLHARGAGTTLDLTGSAEVPLGRGGEVTVAMSGERLDSLNKLVDADLPAYGPWTLRGPVQITPRGHSVTQLTATVGSSTLHGQVDLDLTGRRPRFDARLWSPQFQMDDFPIEARARRNRGESRQDALRASARAAAGGTQQLLDRAFLHRFDGTVHLDADRVLTGRQALADGRLRATLDHGRLTVHSLRVNMPGGSADIEAVYDARGDDIDMAIVARVDRFDYAALAERFMANAGLAGLISVDIALRARAPSIDAFFANANGHLDFALWPTDLGSGVLDRWSINAFRTLLPFLDRGAQSTVNCFVGILDFNDGVVEKERLVIDTTRVRATGTGRASFVTEEVSFRFSPRAKGVTFFSLQTPLRIAGTMSDFRIFAAPGDWLEAVTRFFGSVVLVPLEIWRNGPLPADGADVCTDPLRRR